MIDRLDLAGQLIYTDIRQATALLKNFDRPKFYKAKYDFTTGLAENFLDNEFRNKRNCDYIVCDLAHTIRRPNFLKGEALKPSQDAAFLQVPYIDIFLEVSGCPQMSLTDGDQPLETVSRPINVPRVITMDPFPFMLPGLETLAARCTLSTDFSAENGELPLELTLVLGGYALTCKQYALRKWERCCDILEDEYPRFLVKYIGHDKIDRSLVEKSFDEKG